MFYLKLKNFNQEEFETVLLESVLVAGGISGIYTGNIAQTAGSMMLAAAISPITYGVVLSLKSAFRRGDE